MDTVPVIRILDRVGGVLVPMVVVAHALQGTCSETNWRLVDLRASGQTESLFPGGMLALEKALPRDVDLVWLEQLALVLDDIETIKFVSVAAAGDTSSSVACIDSSYWEIIGPLAASGLLRGRFNEVETL
jgi:hypothetical protein